MLSWPNLLNERRAVLSTLIVAQLALSILAFSEMEIPCRIEIMIGIGDCQIALAMVIGACSTLRWSLRLPVVAVFLFSGWALHYVCWIRTVYPMVSGEDYLISLLLAGSVFVSLWVVQLRQSAVLVHGDDALAPAAGSGKRFTLRDLLLWILAVGLLITIGRQAVILTDVSGMYDPWETIQFGVFEMPTWIFARLPLLLMAILLHGIAWSAITALLLRAGRRTWQWASILAVYSALTIGEIVISSGYVLFDMTFPLLPVSMLRSFFLAKYLEVLFEGRPEFADVAWEQGRGLAIILLTRLITFTMSLLLLRSAGFRLIPRYSDRGR